ncbi:methionyl-tRNA formyltransferase [bacterium]|nr:methionyl-tRNA formyltransferase [bacterium]
MKLVLMGTNDFVVPIFEGLRAAGHDIIAVYTAAPAVQGRKRILTPSPVHAWADAHGIPVCHRARDFNHKPDFTVVVSYGEMLRDNVLSAAPCINIHPSSLPQYRGPSPIKTAIYNGDTASAVCLMAVTPECDAGDVFMRRPFDIGENDTNTDIEAKVSQIGRDMLMDYLKAPGDFPAVPQTGTPTFTRKFTGADEIIDWTRASRDIHNQVRALGGGRTKINGVDVKILETRMRGGELDIRRVQPAGKKPMDWASFVNGQHGADIRMGV